MTERMHVFMCICVTVRLIAKEGKKERDFQLYSLPVTGDYPAVPFNVETAYIFECVCA